MSLCASRLAAACAVAVWATAAPAWAEDLHDTEAPVARARVDVLIAGGSAEEADTMEASLRELLQRLSLDVAASRASRADASPAASGSPAAATIRIDLGDDSAVSATVEDDTHTQVLHRAIRREGSTAIADEELAHVVYSSVEALLDPARRRAAPLLQSVRPVLVTSDAPPDATPPAEARSGLGLDLMAFGVARELGGGAGFVPGGGLGAGLALSRSPWVPELWILGELQAPYDTGDSTVSVRTSVTAVRMVASFAVVRGGRLRLDVGLGGGADITSIAPRDALIPAARLERDQVEVTAPLTGLADVRVRVVQSLELTLAVGADVDVEPLRYAVQRGGTTSAVFEPSRMRPFALVGVSFRALGDARAAAEVAR